MTIEYKGHTIHTNDYLNRFAVLLNGTTINTMTLTEIKAVIDEAAHE